jgi:hypothetical protein
MRALLIVQFVLQEVVLWFLFSECDVLDYNNFSVIVFSMMTVVQKCGPGAARN